MRERDQQATREQLVRALVATGDEDRAAFDLLYSLTSAKLFGICLRICVERQAAEDVLQDVYLTIWKRAGGYDPGRASPIAWLATIARNRSIDWRRSCARRPAMVTNAPEAIDPALMASDALLLDEEERRLHACLEQLAEASRSAIRAAFFDGLTYAELAERQAVPTGTMKSWIRRGLLRLRDCLDDER